MQHLRVHRRLDEIVAGTGLKRQHGHRHVSLTGHEDHRNERIGGPDTCQYVEPVHPRHQVIQQDGFEFFAAKVAQPFLGGCRLYAPCRLVARLL